MFERTLADLIRGLRACSKQDEPAFIAKAVDEIRNEVKSKDMELKAAAILKLAYVLVLLCHALTVTWSWWFRTNAMVRIVGHDGIRYVMGFLPCRGSYVIAEDSFEGGWLFGRGSVIQSGHRRFDADDEHPEESAPKSLVFQ
jgi:hypothetical protein